MKDLIFIFIIGLFLTSCGSDNLSNSKAAKIIAKCLKENPKPGQELFKTGEVKFYYEKKDDSKKLAFLKKLVAKGYLKMDSVKASKRHKYTIYNVSFTDKSKDYVLESEGGGFGFDSFFSSSKNKSKTATVKTFDRSVDKVKEVHERPSFNAAEVTVIYKKQNKTPFFELSRDKTDFITKKVTFRKTSNGWQYCD